MGIANSTSGSFGMSGSGFEMIEKYKSAAKGHEASAFSEKSGDVVKTRAALGFFGRIVNKVTGYYKNQSVENKKLFLQSMEKAFGQNVVASIKQYYEKNSSENKNNFSFSSGKPLLGRVVLQVTAMATSLKEIENQKLLVEGMKEEIERDHVNDSRFSDYEINEMVNEFDKQLYIYREKVGEYNKNHGAFKFSEPGLISSGSRAYQFTAYTDPAEKNISIDGRIADENEKFTSLLEVSINEKALHKAGSNSGGAGHSGESKKRDINIDIDASARRLGILERQKLEDGRDDKKTSFSKSDSKNGGSVYAKKMNVGNPIKESLSDLERDFASEVKELMLVKDEIKEGVRLAGETGGNAAEVNKGLLELEVEIQTNLDEIGKRMDFSRSKNN